MERKLFVGNLSPGITQEALHALFAQAGEVVAVSVVWDTATERARGFVEMGSAAEAETALRRFAGYHMEGRQLFVGEYRQRSVPAPPTIH